MGASENFNVPPWRGRREEAARLLDAGLSVAAVAEELGLSAATARRYDTVFRAGGKSALLRLGDVGHPRRMSSGDLSQLIGAIKHSPSLHGFPGQRWTNEAVGGFIERQFGIRYSRSHINRLIRDLGLREYVQ